jgi:hypothetical protein
MEGSGAQSHIVIYEYDAETFADFIRYRTKIFLIQF